MSSSTIMDDSERPIQFRYQYRQIYRFGQYGKPYRYRVSGIGYRLSVIGYRLLIIGYRLSVIGKSISVAYRYNVT